MKRSGKTFLFLIAAILLSSCVTPPYISPHLAVDFQGTEIPVMLTPPEDESSRIETAYSSGIIRSMYMMSYGYSSVQFYSSSAVNEPLNRQLLPVIIAAPSVIYINDIRFTEYYMESMFAGMMDEKTLLHINTITERRAEK